MLSVAAMDPPQVIGRDESRRYMTGHDESCPYLGQHTRRREVGARFIAPDGVGAQFTAPMRLPVEALPGASIGPATCPRKRTIGPESVVRRPILTPMGMSPDLRLVREPRGRRRSAALCKHAGGSQGILRPYQQ